MEKFRFPIFSRPFNRSNDVLILSLDFSTISFFFFSNLNCELEAGSVIRSAGDLPLAWPVSFVPGNAINRNIRGCAYCILIYTQM